MKILLHPVFLLLSSFFIHFNSAAQDLKSTTASNINLPPVPSFSLDFDAVSLKNAGASYPSGQGFSFIQGKNGRPSVQFNSLDQPSVIQIPNNPALQFSDAASFDMWVKITADSGMNSEGNKVRSAGAIMSLLAKSHDRNGFALTTWHDGYVNFVSYDQTWRAVACENLAQVSSIPYGEWFRITAVASSRAGTAIYVNKQLAINCLNARPNFSASNAQDLYIGRFKDKWYPLYGAIQDLRIYQHALSEQQILALP